MISIERCPICLGSDFRTHFACEDKTVSHETFSIKVCVNCTLGITSPRPEQEKLSSYYQSSEYISHSGKASGIISGAYLLARKFTLRWKRNLLQNFYKEGSLLDYGCGTGEFLHTMQSAGWSIQGIEPSDVARKKATELTGRTIETTITTFKPETFHAITLWHVLEHVPDLNEKLNELRVLIKQHGIIFIAVPNYLSADSVFYKEHWAGYDTPRHLWHFTKESMTRLLEKSGFKLEAIKPMKLDAFYISMLSEKNQGKKTITSFTNALIRGTISNYKGKSTMNYSSHIYIARPQ